MDFSPNIMMRSCIIIAFDKIHPMGTGPLDGSTISTAQGPAIGLQPLRSDGKGGLLPMKALADLV
jgi:hypothetical protein